MQTTTNYALKLYEGTDLFNPLTVENVNTGELDTVIKAVSDSAVGTAVEYLTANVHTLTRDDTDRPVFHFVATSNYTAGDVFVVDGQQVTAHTPDGQSLSTGAFIIGAGVLCVLDGTVLTLIVNPAKALDADQLDGHDSTYFATAAGIAATNANVDTISNKIGTGVPSTQAQTVIGAINEINNNLTLHTRTVSSAHGIDVIEKSNNYSRELLFIGTTDKQLLAQTRYPFYITVQDFSIDNFMIEAEFYSRSLCEVFVDNGVLYIIPGTTIPINSSFYLRTVTL